MRGHCSVCTNSSCRLPLDQSAPRNVACGKLILCYLGVISIINSLTYSQNPAETADNMASECSQMMTEQEVGYTLHLCMHSMHDKVFI